MKKLILFIGFILFVNLLFAQRREVDADAVLVRDSIIVQGHGTFGDYIVLQDDTIRFLTPIDGQVLTRVNGVWKNENSSLTLPIDSLVFSKQANLVHEEGKVFYDSVKHALSYYTESPDVTVNSGREGLSRRFNGTGIVIPNGTPVYERLGDSIDFASKFTFPTSRVVGVTTEDIGIDEYGEVTIYGDVGGSFSWLTNQIFLGDSVLTNDVPSGGEFICFIGHKRNDTTIFINSMSATFTADMLQYSGWPDSDDNNWPDNVDIEIIPAERKIVLTATPAASYYHYQNGIKYISSRDTLIWANTEGGHIIYMDGGKLEEIVNPTASQARDVIKNYAPVTSIYWSISQNTTIYANNSFHKFDMNGETRAFGYDIHKCEIIENIPLTDFDTDQSGSLDSHAQFGNNSGKIRNVDIVTSVPATASTTGYGSFYRTGTSNWERTFNPGFGCINTGTGRVAYNENVGGVWQLTEATSNYYVPYYVLTTNGLTLQTGMIPGAGEYQTTTAAVEAAVQYIPQYIENLPSNEIATIGIVIYQTKDSYTNSVKARLVTMTDPITGTTVDYINVNRPGIVSYSGSTGMSTILDDPNGPGTYAGAGGDIFTVSPSELGWEFTPKIDILLTEFDSTGFRLTQNQIIDLNDTISDLRSDIDANLDSINTFRPLIDANTAKVTNATHTGEVTGATALTITDDVVDGENLKATNSPIDNYVPSFNLGTGGFTWVVMGGGTTDYISNVTESGNNITFTGVGNAFNGSIGTIAKTDEPNAFLDSQSIGGDGNSTTLTVTNSFVNGQGIRIAAGVNTDSDDYMLKLEDGSTNPRFNFLSNGKMYANSLTNATKTDVLYRDPSTGEITFGTAPGGGGDLWQSVTNGIAPATISDVVYIGSTSGTGGGIYELDLDGRGIVSEELVVASFIRSAYNTVAERATIGTPSATIGHIWMDSDDDKLYFTNSTTTYDLTASGGTPGGSDGDIQYNNSSSFGGFGDWNGTSLVLDNSDNYSLYNSANTDYDYINFSSSTTNHFKINAGTTATGASQNILDHDMLLNLVSLSGALRLVNASSVSASALAGTIFWNTTEKAIEVETETIEAVIHPSGRQSITSATSMTFDWDNGNKATLTLAHDNSTLTFTDIPDIAEGVIYIRQDAGGANSLSFAETITAVTSIVYSGGLELINETASSRTKVKYEVANDVLYLDILWYE